MLEPINHRMRIINANITLATLQVGNVTAYFEYHDMEGMHTFDFSLVLNSEEFYAISLDDVLMQIRKVESDYYLEHFEDVAYEESDREALQKAFLYLLTEFAVLLLEHNDRQNLYEALTVEEVSFFIDILTDTDNPYRELSAKRISEYKKEGEINHT